jgi:Asp-tRNA(Asn)/Glu-tRNA(Gln) amidotransferase A subunit family amidase
MSIKASSAEAPDQDPEKRPLLSDYIRERAEFRRRQGYPELSYADSLQVRAGMWRSLLAILARHDLLLCPTNAVGAVAAEHSPVAEGFTIDGKATDPGLGWNMTWPFNLLPQAPVATVPSGFDRHGVPTGLQIVGRPFDDRAVFAAAAAFERARPWSGHRPAL